MEQNLTAILQEQLRGLHQPEAISWWPMAPGWWILLFIVISLIAWCTWLLIRHFQKNRYKKQACSELELAHIQWAKDSNASIYIQSANAILKRALIVAGANTHTVSRTGKDWEEILNIWAKKPLLEKSVYALSESAYQAKPDADIEELHRDISYWLRTHKKPVNKKPSDTGVPNA